MRVFFSTVFAATFAAQSLLAQGCPTLCDYNFLRGASIVAVQAAIDEGEDINAQGEYGDTAFSIILSLSANEFLEYNPDGDAVVEQMRLDGLTWFLIASGVDLEANGYVGTSYLNLAAKNAPTTVVRHLIEKGASVLEVDAEQENALHYATVGGNAETMELLIQAGIDIHAANEDGDTPLHLAAASVSSQPAATMVWLIDHGANVNTQAGTFRTTPMMDFLFWGAEARVEDAPIVMKAAIDAGYDITLENHIGSNILHYAAWVGRDPGLVQYLIDQGADISVGNSEGNTAYDLALENYYLSDTEIMDVLKP